MLIPHDNLLDSMASERLVTAAEVLSPEFSNASTTYFEYKVPYTADPVVFLRNALEHGLVGNDYLLYRNQDEVLIAGDPLARLTVGTDAIALTYDYKTQLVPAHDPFAQIPTLLAGLPVEGWRAYGYIGFDVARFYYAYNKAMDCPLLSFFVPSFEARLTPHGATIRSTRPVSRLEDLFVTHHTNGDHHYSVSTPAAEAGEQEVYQDRVASLIKAIKQGELHKAIISRSLELQGAMDIFATYALSSQHNTAARSYCMNLGKVRTVGFSPEILMAVDHSGFVMTNPLAATRRRGHTSAEDQVLHDELFSDAKEVKEHALSIWLAQSEIDSICVPGTTRIFDFMQVKKYRTVQHLSSRAGGQLRPGYTLWNGLHALFPGITIAGIDKASAVAWIDRLEDKPRGAYAGAIGWIDSSGAADLAITLRSIYQYGDKVVFQAGAGIVGESRPEFEYVETVNKMKMMLNYLVME